MIFDGTVASWVFFNVGDARVYRHRGSTLQQVTVDHSLGQELYAAGRISADELAVFPDRNVVTRAMGATDSRADSWVAPVMHGERILVCSDGLPTEVPDEVIRATLTSTGGAEAAASALIALAMRAGARDNVTVIVADVVAGGLTAADDPEHDGFFLDETTEPARQR
jgi:protein phosphatase